MSDIIRKTIRQFKKSFTTSAALSFSLTARTDR